MEGKKQQTAAAMAGMSELGAEVAEWPVASVDQAGAPVRTRFDGVWEEEILPLLRGEAAGRLRATNYRVAGGEISRPVQHLPAPHPATPIQDWRALNGPEQEVYFPQEHPPGREAQIDFTHCNFLGS